MIDKTHDPTASSWVPGAANHSEFPVQNLPLGIFAPKGGGPRIGAAIGDWVIDLAAIANALPEELGDALQAKKLNDLLALPAPARNGLRHALFGILTNSSGRERVTPHLYAQNAIQMHLPARIGDYTDFYVGIHHATNIGSQFRPENPLLPNYKYVPIGYHGRASSIRVSGEPVHRPSGQHKNPDAAEPDYGPCRRLDYELEMGVWIAGENALGKTVPIAEAWERIAGLCLLNDWSARDIQAWEYQPLGPFLAKNFLTTISPWLVTAEALAPFRIAQPARPEGDPLPLPYLWDAEDQAHGALAIQLGVSLSTAKMRESGIMPKQLSSGPASNMYWTVAQMVAHHAANGCNLMPGDLLGTGTISGPDNTTLGSIMEISQGGMHSIELPTGEMRTFLESGDQISLHARAEREGFRSIGFGPCSGVIV
jgi:fumarylacetoacetase